MTVYGQLPTWTPRSAEPTGCEVCGTHAVTVDGYCGKRCAAHPPAYDPGVTVALLLAGRPDDAAAYKRTWAALAAEQDTAA